MEESKPNASRFDHAAKILNAYRNAHYADALTEESCELANAINDILPFAVNAYRRPSPENNPLTLDELREMDGEPVYIVEGSKAKGHWELSEDAYDYFDDRDPDFYGMHYDDPDGHFGLYVLGWEAYRRKPEGAEKK